MTTDSSGGADKTDLKYGLQTIDFRTFILLDPPHAANHSDITTELSASIKRKKIVEICKGCGQKILDRYLMRVGELSWHEHCLSCWVCGCPLAHTCYTRNAKLYCKPDYYRLFGLKCTRCGDRLLPQEIVMRAQQYVFHKQCFVCVMCCEPLQKGEQYVIRAGQIFCRQDFEKKMYLMQHAEDDMILNDSERPRDGRRGPKRPRTILTSAQRRQLLLGDRASDTKSLQNLEVQHHSYQHPGHSAHEPLNLSTGSVVNPIDKSYLMQNSYLPTSTSTDHSFSVGRDAGAGLAPVFGQRLRPTTVPVYLPGTVTSHHLPYTDSYHNSAMNLADTMLI